jgi:hypothetical protein
MAEKSIFASGVLKDGFPLVGAMVWLGPLGEYMLEHVALYRARMGK